MIKSLILRIWKKLSRLVKIEDLFKKRNPRKEEKSEMSKLVVAKELGCFYIPQNVRKESHRKSFEKREGELLQTLESEFQIKELEAEVVTKSGILRIWKDFSVKRFQRALS